MCTSSVAIGISFGSFELSRTKVTFACGAVLCPSFVPEKITPASLSLLIFFERNCPITNCIASEMFDLPQPLGPLMTVNPLVRLRVIFRLP